MLRKIGYETRAFSTYVSRGVDWHTYLYDELSDMGE